MDMIDKPEHDKDSSAGEIRNKIKLWRNDSESISGNTSNLMSQQRENLEAKTALTEFEGK
jgi:hypothetical protein